MHVTLVHPHIVCFLNLLEKKSTSKQMKLCTQRRVLLWLHCIEAWNAKSWRIPIIRFCIGGSIYWWMDQTQTDGWDCTTATVEPLCQGMLTPKFTKAYLMFYAVKSKEMQGLFLLQNQRNTWSMSQELHWSFPLLVIVFWLSYHRPSPQL